MNAGILVSDGYSNVMQNNTIPEANRLKALNVRMYSVVVTDEYNLDEMSQVASNSTRLIASSNLYQYVYFLKNSTYISSVANDILNDLCSP